VQSVAVLINIAVLGEVLNARESKRCLLQPLHSTGIKKLLAGRGRFVSTGRGSLLNSWNAN